MKSERCADVLGHFSSSLALISPPLLIQASCALSHYKSTSAALPLRLDSEKFEISALGSEWRGLKALSDSRGKGQYSVTELMSRRFGSYVAYRHEISHVGVELAALLHKGSHGGDVTSCQGPIFIPDFFVCGAVPVSSMRNLTLKWIERKEVIRMVVNVAAGTVAAPGCASEDDVVVCPSADGSRVTLIPEWVDISGDLMLMIGCRDGVCSGGDGSGAVAIPDSIVQREHALRSALTAAACRDQDRPPAVVVRVPVYYGGLALQDNGSQRLQDSLCPLSRLLDAIAENDLMFQNSTQIIALLANQSSGCVDAVPSDDDVRCTNAVIVQCMQGVSRSVAAVMWYTLWKWMARLGQRDDGVVSFATVLEAIRRARPCACPNLCFAAEMQCMVRKWATRHTQTAKPSLESPVAQPSPSVCA